MIGRRASHGKFEATHIDMVPMVDCIMVLLIFLMISSSFVNDPGVEVERPDVSSVQAASQSALLIAIAPDNRIYFDGQQVPIDQIASLIKQAAIGRAPILVIRADRAASHGTFAAVYTEAKRAGIEHVQFATARSE